jgi:hypothetical protein
MAITDVGNVYEEIARKEAAKFGVNIDDLPEVEYPAEVVERWLKIAEITKQQYATGELEDTDLEGLAAEMGINLEEI